MDIVHHALIGGAGFLGAVAADAPLVGAAFVAGSVFPDLDVMFMAFGKRFFLRNHQGITHSLILAPVYALAISGLLALLPEIAWSWHMWLGALAGLLAHVTLDWLNTFRIAILAPFGRRRFSADAVFFVDGVALAMTALFYLAYLHFDFQAALWLYPLLFACYLVAKWRLRRWVEITLRPLFAIPASLNPFEFYILEMQDGMRIGYVFNTLTRKRTRRAAFPPAAEKYQRLAEKSGVYRDMALITRAFHITDVHEDASGITIHAADIAVRNYGGRFGKTELRFDPTGKLVHEMANI